MFNNGGYELSDGVRWERSGWNLKGISAWAAKYATGLRAGLP